METGGLCRRLRPHRGIASRVYRRGMVRAKQTWRLGVLPSCTEPPSVPGRAHAVSLRLQYRSPEALVNRPFG